jgi:hypothetical protein
LGDEQVKRSTSLTWCFGAAVLLAASNQQAHGQIMYRWLRTNQQLGARSNVTVSATGFTGGTTGGGLPRVVTDQDILPLGDSRSISREARGGEGGGGGDDGNLFMPLGGAQGDDFTPLDGADGAGPLGGKGGQAGDNGEATASGTTVAIDELNPDFQTILSYSWIHNQWGDLNLQAAGGGGGGGAGTDGYVYDPFMNMWWFTMGGPGGGGGRGNDTSGSITNSQDSDVTVNAVCIVDPGISPPPTNTPAIDCSITLDMGWVSAPNPDWFNGAPGTSPWARSINMTISAGQSVVNISGAGMTTITVFAVDDLGFFYWKESAYTLDSDIGSFGLGMGEIGLTRIAPGQTASIVTPANGINSTLSGSMMADGGWGGGGATGAGGGFGGMHGGLGLGAQGGEGGDGGGVREVDVDNDQIIDFWLGPGGGGGDGGNGDHINEHKDGIYQGVVMIMMG